MRRSSLVGFVTRFLPAMSPVRGIPPPPASSPTTPTASTATTTTTCRLGSNDSPTTTMTTQQQQQQQRQEPTPVLLLEGDNFEVSHDGIARTFYHLDDNNGSSSTPLPDACSSSSSSWICLGIEEYYDLKDAHKTFVLRQQHQPVLVGDENNNQQQQQQHDDDEKLVLLGKRAQGLAPMGPQLGRIDIQEIDQGVFGSAGTGATTWESSLAMGLYFANHADLLVGDLLEIGSGVGVGAILSHMGPLACQHDLRYLQSVTLTDGNEQCLQQCRKNIRHAWHDLSRLYPPDKKGKNPPQVKVLKLDWNQDVDSSMRQRYDTIIACDVCYLYPDIEPLAQTIHKLLKKDTGCLHLFGPYNRGAFQHLCQRLHQDMHVTIESLGLERYRLKPAENIKHHAADDSPAPQHGTAILPRERVYASKSQATILHVTVRHYNAQDQERNNWKQPSTNMRDLD